jgi:hypothetical protein
MFDAKAAALKKMKVKSPMAGLHKAIPLESKKDEAKEEAIEKGESDLAPNLKSKSDPVISSELTDDHMGLMKELSDGVSHPGRGAMTLDERAASGMKAKMASMKHKK